MLGMIFVYYHGARFFRRDEAATRARKAIERQVAAASHAA